MLIIRHASHLTRISGHISLMGEQTLTWLPEEECGKLYPFCPDVLNPCSPEC